MAPDNDTNAAAPRLAVALQDVSERSAELYVLGSYPVSRGVQ